MLSRSNENDYGCALFELHLIFTPVHLHIIIYCFQFTQSQIVS